MFAAWHFMLRIYGWHPNLPLPRFFMGRVRRSLRAAFHKKNPGECPSASGKWRHVFSGFQAPNQGTMMEPSMISDQDSGEQQGMLHRCYGTHGSLATCRFRILTSRQAVKIHAFWENEVSLNQSGGLNMRQMVVCLLTTINQRSGHSPLRMYINVWPTIAIQWTRVDQTCWSRYMYYSGYAQLYKQHNINIGDGVLHGGSPIRVTLW